MTSQKFTEIVNDATTLLKIGKSIEEVSQTILNLHGVSLNDAHFMFVFAGLCKKFNRSIS